MEKNLKSYIELLTETPLITRSFYDSDSVFSSFNKEFDEDIHIVYASYDEQWGYDGQAYVIYKRKSNNQYYLTTGGHCSCYGLEDQWDRDEELSFEGLQHTLNEGDIYNCLHDLKEGLDRYLGT